MNTVFCQKNLAVPMVLSKRGNLESRVSPRTVAPESLFNLFFQYILINIKKNNRIKSSIK